MSTSYIVFHFHVPISQHGSCSHLAMATKPSPILIYSLHPNNAVQVAAIKILTNQIENADLEKKSIIVMGDSNVCASKWNESNFKHKNVAEEIKGS